MQALSIEATEISQQTASSPQNSVWVNANAGTGKTKVLTDRVLRLLLSGAAAESILCITFTTNAAAEMQNRLLERAEEWLHASDQKLTEMLHAIIGVAPDTDMITRARALYLQLSDAPHVLHFTTIHGFAQELLQQFPLEAGLAPYFTVMDEPQSKALLWEAAQQLLRRMNRPHVAELGEALQVIAQTVNDDEMLKLLKAMVDTRHHVAPYFNHKERARLHKAIDAFCDIDKNAPVPHVPLMQYEAEQLNALRALIPVLEVGNKTEQKAAPYLARWTEYASQATFDEGAYNDYASVILTQSNTPKKLLSKDNTKRYPEYVALLEAEQQRLLRYDETRRSLALAAISHAFVTVSEEVNALYEQRKRARNALDFDDLIEHTLALLKNSALAPWVLYKMDRRIAHIMLDEAQDTSPQQWELILQLCEEYVSQSPEKTVFVVGDTKQSIYGFQGAKPSELAQHKANMQRFVQMQQSELKTVAMQRSFRSTSAVLQTVDACFEDVSRRQELHYSQETISHSVHREEQWGRVESWPVLSKDDKQDAEPFSLPIAYEAQDSGQSELAQTICDQICAWLKEGAMLPSRNRPIRAGDILVLVRSRKPFVKALSSLLKRANIPVAGADRLVLQSHLMVQDLVALGQWCCLSQDDYSLACILKSPIFGLDEEALFALAHGREGTLWNAIKKGDAPELCEVLESMQLLAQGTSPAEFFAAIALRYDIEKRYGAYYGSEAREMLQLFLEAIERLQEQGYANLTACLHQFSSQSQEVKQQMETARDEVRIMTVHGAKGLQAPIVFLPEIITKEPRRLDVFWQGEALLYAPNKDYHTKRFSELKAEAQRAELQERTRLCYVAMTRAEDWLLNMAFCSAKELPEHSWTRWIREALRKTNAQEDTEETLVLQTGQGVMQEKQPMAADFGHTPFDVRLLDPILSEMSVEMQTPSNAVTHDATIETQGHESSAQRGNRIHKLLEIFTTLPAEHRTLALAQRVLHAEDCESEFAEVQALYANAQLAEMFANPLRFEVPVLGAAHKQAERTVFRGAIDCLIHREEDVVIMDFKTGARPVDGVMPLQYRMQLEAYQELMQQAAPEQTYSACLLWTQSGELQWL